MRNLVNPRHLQGREIDLASVISRIFRGSSLSSQVLGEDAKATVVGRHRFLIQQVVLWRDTALLNLAL